MGVENTGDLLLPTSPLYALRLQLPYQLRDRYAIALFRDAYNLRAVGRFTHMGTGEKHEFTLESGLRIPELALARLCLDG